MSELDLEVNFTKLVAAVKSLNDLSNAWEKMTNDVIKANARISSSVSKTEKAQFANDRKKIAMMKNSQAMEVRAAQQAENSANKKIQASNREANEVERLKIKYREGYAATAKYNSLKAEISRAHSINALSLKEETVQLQLLTNEYNEYANGVALAGNRFASMGQRTQGVNTSIGRSSQVATKRMSSMGVVTQQVGYQVGDFAVQVQSGQSALVAFSQQATQLVGVLPMVHKQLGMTQMAAIGLSAGLGIGIPVVTAIASVLWTSMSAADDASESLMTLSSIQEDLAKSTAEATLQLVMQENALSDLATAFLFGELEEAKQDLDDYYAKVDETFYNLRALSSIAVPMTPLETEAARLAFYDNMSQTQKDELQALQDIYNTQVSVLRNDEARERSQERQISLIEEWGDFFEAAQERIDASAEGVRNMTSQSQTARAVASELMKEWVSLFETVTDLKDELGDAAYEVLRLAGVDIESPISKAVKAAAELAAKLDISLVDAYKIGNADVSSGVVAAAIAAKQLATDLNISFRAALAMQGMISNRPTNDVFDPRSDSYNSPESSNERIRRIMESGTLEESTLPDVPDKSGSEAADKLDFVQALEAEMAVRGELVKLFGDEYELQSEIARIVKGLGEDSGDYNAQSIEALAQQNLLLIEQENLREESVKQMQNVYDMLGNEMGTAFTSMIDGTKSVEDAFKSMAKNIIDQLIQIFIVEQMVNSITGGGGILGGLFGGGSSTNVVSGPMTSSIRPQMRAGGGPVTSGMPYIVGENEPELFVPNTSGNIYNQKQMANMSGNGSGDNVVIHQSFNFQANGDDTVKRLIQQAAPQIAQMTKSSMLNDRRRGGQTKSVFG
jgi:hypothetical protein